MIEFFIIEFFLLLFLVSVFSVTEFFVTDFSLFSQENSSIVDLSLSSPELSDDDEIIDLETLEYDNEILTFY